MTSDLMELYERDIELCAWGRKLSPANWHLTIECVLLTLHRYERERHWFHERRSLLEALNEVRQLPMFGCVEESSAVGLLIRLAYDEQLLVRCREIFTTSWQTLDLIIDPSTPSEQFGVSFVMLLTLPDDFIVDLLDFTQPISTSVQPTETIHLTIANVALSIPDLTEAKRVCSAASKRLQYETDTNANMKILLKSLSENLSVDHSLYLDTDGALPLFFNGDCLRQIHNLRALYRSTVLPDLNTTYERGAATAWSHATWGRINKELMPDEIAAMRKQVFKSGDASITLHGSQPALIVYNGKASGLLYPIEKLNL